MQIVDRWVGVEDVTDVGAQSPRSCGPPPRSSSPDLPSESGARHDFIAEFGLRLARRGYVEVVGVTVAGGTPAEALLAVLAEIRGSR